MYEFRELCNLSEETKDGYFISSDMKKVWNVELNILSYFDYILCGDQVKNRKPHPETYLKVLAHFNMNPKNTLVLEDSLVGVEAAYKAGTICIMIPDLIAATPTQETQTFAIVETMHDVLKMMG